MSMSRRNSVSGGVKSGRESLEVPRERHAALAPALSTEIEADGDDDVTNGMHLTFTYCGTLANSQCQSVSHEYNQEKTNHIDPSTHVAKPPSTDLELL